ncbi:MAG TPA: hypothetical protein VGD83_37115, partial [Streptosporangiaceae bacterium]
MTPTPTPTSTMYTPPTHLDGTITGIVLTVIVAVLALAAFIPKLRVVWIPRPPLACAFALGLRAVSDYLRRVSGMAVPMSSKAWRCSL